MNYVGDVAFWATTLLGIAAIIFATSLKLRGKGYLLAFVILSLFSYVGYYVPSLLIRNEAMTYDTYRKFMEPAGVVLTLARITGWALLLAFVISLKSATTSGAIGGTRPAGETMTVARALFSFEGRLSRSDYWLKGFLPMLPVGILNNVLAYGVAADWARVWVISVAVLSLWPSLALIVKRLHDRDTSGWFALIMLIPLIGPLLIVVGVWFMKGTDGPNRFGPDPLQPAPATS